MTHLEAKGTAGKNCRESEKENWPGGEGHRKVAPAPWQVSGRSLGLYAWLTRSHDQPFLPNIREITEAGSASLSRASICASLSSDLACVGSNSRIFA